MILIEWLKAIQLVRKRNSILVTPLDLHILHAFPYSLLLSVTILYSCTGQLTDVSYIDIHIYRYKYIYTPLIRLHNGKALSCFNSLRKTIYSPLYCRNSLFISSLFDFLELFSQLF